MPLTLSRPPSRELASPRMELTRRLSIEEKYSIAETARRKSSSEASQRDLRVLIGHSNMLEMLLQDIAMDEQAVKSAPPSPKGKPADLHVNWAGLRGEEASHIENVEEYDDGAEDLESLSLVRTTTRRR